MQNLFTQKSLRSMPFFALFAIFSLSIWFILRVVLALNVGLSHMNFGEMIGAFAKGLWFDFAALGYLIVPWLLLSAFIPNRWRNKPWVSKVRWVVAFLVTFGLIFSAVSEFIFWQEFTTRFNFIAVDYLIYTNEVIGNIRESYPVPLILLAIALLVLAILFSVSRFVRFDHTPKTTKNKLALLTAAIALPVLSYQTTNVDQMEFSKNAYANELAGNGVFSFSAAARRNELDYDRFYKTIPEAQALNTLKAVGLVHNAVQPPELTDLGPFKRAPKNVVLISVESLSADYLGTYGNKENLTPYLDKLAKESLVFDKLFATGTRTVRGLDALSIGIPPIPGQAIVHRPNGDHLATIGEILRAQNFETMFIYGGYGAAVSYTHLDVYKRQG